MSGKPTQLERVIKAAQSYRGITQVDFLAPDVVDGGPPITRLAARLYEAEALGHSFECLGRRDKCKVWRLVGVERGAVEPAVPPTGSGPSLSTDSLFGVPRVQGTPHWKADAA